MTVRYTRTVAGWRACLKYRPLVEGAEAATRPEALNNLRRTVKKLGGYRAVMVFKR